MRKRGFFYLKNTLILSFLLFLFLSIPPVFASEINQSLTYDGNGNLITGDGKYREYNEFNQLIRVYNGSINDSDEILEEYVYHPTEDRIFISFPDHGPIYPREAVVYISKNIERVYDNLGGIPHVNYTYYIFDETGIVGEITKNISYYEEGNPYYQGPPTILGNLSYHNDYSGSVSLITNNSGSVVEETFYEPFGGILQGGEISRYSYEGKEFSSVTEDFDFHFRKYNPSLMIFTQPDSVIANVYDPQSLNRYAFERNNPYKYVDEDGKSFTLIALALTGVFLFNFVMGIIRSSNEDSQGSYAEFTGEGMYNSFGTDEGIVMTGVGIGAAGELETILKSGKNIGSVGIGESVNLKGSSNPTVKSAIEYGKKQHNEFYNLKSSEGFSTNKAIPGTNLRPDALNQKTKTIIEFKPDSNSGIKSGQNQIKKYEQAATKVFGGKWKSFVQTYKNYKSIFGRKK